MRYQLGRAGSKQETIFCSIDEQSPPLPIASVASFKRRQKSSDD